MGISRFFVTDILREINSGEFRESGNSKTTIFSISEALNVVNFGKFEPSKSA